ncbi:fimbrial biogenesis outer membrane usher protein [Klebsiella huaxiensis]|uniref:fimbria/pilus outer membrane usher protein n=1 Tax=Klebsiella huaxiensis TaxID=2153354 RepID=UPI002F339B3B
MQYTWKSGKQKLKTSLTPISLGLFAVFGSIPESSAEENLFSQDIVKNVEFESEFLNLDKKDSLDLSRFANGSSALPGIYRVAVYVNNSLVSNDEIEFKLREDKSVYPALTRKNVNNIDFNYSKLPSGVFAPLEQDTRTIDLQKQLPEAKISFDSSEQRLDILIPQIYMNNTARGSVNPALWDSGVPALKLGYNINGYTSESQGQTYNSFYSSLNAGLNVGAWYLRHNGNYRWIQDGLSGYETINTYLQRDIPAIKGRLIVGQANTSGQVFDTLSFSGVQLSSDDRMLPGSQRDYAPDVRGIARTNAQVTVRQSGQVIYQTTVTPGEFLINDLYPTGYGGNLEVTVREADGTQNVFTVPYASVAQLLRPGASRYEIIAGEARSDSLNTKPALYQVTYQRGFTNSMTGYGGLQASQDYYAIQGGLAFGLPVGALAIDATQARTHLDNQGNSLSGQSYRISYSKAISETNSNLSLAAYRFSTSGFMDYSTAMQTRDAVQQGYDSNIIWRAKNRGTLTAGQGLSEGWGQLYISASIQNYWNKDGNDQQYQIGYSNQYEWLSYNLSANRIYTGIGEAQTNYLLSFSLPLGRMDETNVPQLNLDLNHDTRGNIGEQLGITGTAGNAGQFSYGVTAMNANHGTGTSGSLSGQYRSPATNLSATYSAGNHYQSKSAGIAGSVVAHPGGITFSPYTGDTLAVVQAKGAEGATVSSYPGIVVDRWGHAIVPYLDPYQMNEISLDPKGIDDNIELENTAQKVAPYVGAVVMLKYNTQRGTPVLILSQYNNEAIPFGSVVFDDTGNNIGSVGQGGQIYARVNKERGQLRIKWGDANSHQCTVDYILAPQQKTNRARIQHFNTPCVNDVKVISEGAVLANN